MTNVRNYIFLACRLRWVNFIRLSCPIRAFIVTISALRLGKKSRAPRQAGSGRQQQAAVSHHHQPGRGHGGNIWTLYMDDIIFTRYEFKGNLGYYLN